MELLIVDNELPPLLQRHECEGAVILPLILSPSQFEDIQDLARFQAVNSPAQPLIALSKAKQETALVELAKAIKAALHVESKDASFEQARARHLEQLKTEIDKHAHLYTPLAGDAVSRLHRKPLPSAAPSALLQCLPRALDGLREPQRESRAYDDIIAAFGDLRQAALIGEPGAGKTTALYRLAGQLLDQADQDPQAPLPVLVPLGEWRQAEQTLPEFIAAENPHLVSFLLDWPNTHRLVLLLDGLNEIPTAQQRDKIQQIELLVGDSKPRFIISCREQDYRDHLKLDLDTLAIRPLTPSRILAFIERYLIVVHDDEAQGRAAAQELFWTLAGGEAVRYLWRTWHAAGAPHLDYFWAVAEIPRENPNILGRMTRQDHALWHQRVKDPRGLIRLTGNPFMLWMMISVYWDVGQLPANRANLFEKFMQLLLAREQLAYRDTLEPSPRGRALLEALGELAWLMQQGVLVRKEDSVQVALSPEQLTGIMDPEQLKRAASASLLETGEQVRFSHQLLQEYFVALGLRTRIEAGQLAATDLWPAEYWWQRSGWEEATILLAGHYPEDCTPIIDWLRDAQPEVAAQCINRSGARIPDATLRRLRDAWLPRLTDLERDPDPRARAAVGRALGSLTLDGRPLDDRPGVRGIYIAEEECAVVDIDWVEIPGGPFTYQYCWDEDRPELDTFWIARYPITHSQFQAFIDDPQGYADHRWWHELTRRSYAPVEPRWQYHNHPRETVNFYEAIAFCRWLSALRDETITLPTEQHWERAAGGVGGGQYPWGEGYRRGFANINETRDNTGGFDLGQTSAVGLYPQGRSAEGVLDMAGNVWEWCLNEYENPEQTELSRDALRVLRGGSWHDNRVGARAVARARFAPHDRLDDLGFRVVRRSAS